MHSVRFYVRQVNESVKKRVNCSEIIAKEKITLLRRTEAGEDD